MTTYSVARPKERFSLTRAWASIDSNLKRLILIGFVEIIAVNLYASVLIPYFRTLGFGSDRAGILSSVLQIVTASVGVFAGVLADTVGRKRLYIAGQVLRCLAAGLLLVTRSYLGFVVVFAVRGFAAIQSPASSAIFAAWTRKEHRSTLFGISQTMSQLAAVLGPLAAGAIADRYGVPYSFLGGLVLACFAVVLALPLKERPPADAVASAPLATQPEGRPAREPLSLRLIAMFAGNNKVALSSLLAASLSNGLANGATNILLPFTIMDRFSSAYTTISASQAVCALGTVLVLLVGGRIADVYGRRGIVLASNAVFPALMLLVFASTSLWQFFVILVLLTMAGNISNPAIAAVQMEAVGERDRATFAGFQMSLNNVGMAAGSIAAGIAYKFSPNWSWVAVIVLFASQLPLYALAIPKEKPPAGSNAPAE